MSELAPRANLQALKMQLRQLVVDAVDSAESKRSYGRAIDHFFTWFENQPSRSFTRETVHAYKSWMLEKMQCAPQTVNLRLAAIRKLAREATEAGYLDPQTGVSIERVSGIRTRGARIGQWLTKAQAEKLLNAPDRATAKGLRDRALLMSMLGAGLRRAEVASLTIDQVQQRDGRWVFVDLVGKGNTTRSVPMPNWVKVAIDKWLAVRTAPASGRDRLFVALVRNEEADRLSDRAIHDIVNDYSRLAGLPKLSPHDLRRTFAKLAEKGHARLNQIQITLGHASIKTTQIYLGNDQDFTEAPCDHLGLDLSE